ncbi:ribosomal RNA small subunit methyltransferase A [bacterium]|nr:ribosomal RNA small subunit methyltransferase A [bacterium]|tara:strand:- start:10590 stop:11375 length:786 start_codon:yes stop_codon:yes gene_type:complete
MRAKKSLGQNFLRSRAVTRDLVDASSIQKTNVVVEVGPGKGIVTHELLSRTKKVIAVEKDERMIEHLKEKFATEISSKNLILVHEDILNFNPRDWKLEIGNWKLIGSIPYYITGVFLRRFLSIEPQPKTIALIIQKEVAQRIVAKDGKESILSISVKAYGEPHYIKTISKKLFSPEPKVNSAIINIDNISKKFFTEFSEEDFFKIVKAGFKSKRKKLLSNLKKEFPKADFEKIFFDLKISPNARAENLTLEQWGTIVKKLS